MRIREIHLIDFRNIVSARLEVEAGDSFFVGANAQGKTALLEACGLVTAMRSFRTSEVRSLIRQDGGGEAQLRIVLDHERRGETSIEIRLARGARRLQLDGEKVSRLQELIGQFPTVAFTSDDLQLVRGSPQDRRRLLDLLLAATSSEYYGCLRRYHISLRERNSVLRQGGDDRQLRAFEWEMAESGAGVVRGRARCVRQLQEDMIALYNSFAPDLERCGLEYRPNLECEEGDAFREALDSNRERDRRTGTTGIGPHKDDLKISLQGMRGREFASEGQQRGLVLALKLASIRWIQQCTGIQPVVLADDVLNELDRDRRRRFWKELDLDVQVLATGTELPETGRNAGWNVWKVNAGNFEKMKGED